MKMIDITWEHEHTLFLLIRDWGHSMAKKYYVLYDKINMNYSSYYWLVLDEHDITYSDGPEKFTLSDELLTLICLESNHG